MEMEDILFANWWHIFELSSFFVEGHFSSSLQGCYIMCILDGGLHWIDIVILGGSLWYYSTHCLLCIINQCFKKDQLLNHTTQSSIKHWSTCRPHEDTAHLEVRDTVMTGGMLPLGYKINYDTASE